jgi:AraC family transcriptional regulator, ethanolamine operon transcriptional activator
MMLTVDRLDIGRSIERSGVLRVMAIQPTRTPTAPLDVPPGVVTLETDDFEELAAARSGWNLRYQQVGSGQFRGSIVSAQGSRIELSKLSRSPGILAQGSAPKGSIALAFSLRPQAAMFYNGAALKVDEIAVAWPNKDFDFRALSPSELVIVRIPEAMAIRHAQALLQMPLRVLATHDRLVASDPELISLASTTFSSLLDTFVRQPQLLAVPRAEHYLEMLVLDTLLGLVDPTGPRILAATRARIARRAEEYLRERLSDPIKMSEMCEVLGTSERLLQLAFIESFGMSPRQLLKTLRLNGAHRDLRKAAPSTSVTTVALDWGFLHLGRFSVAYREMFGETAIATLRRSSSTAHGAGKQPAPFLHRAA